eukprot:TRINITY_DN80244_c0_g1_i1.p1 TRINITY_DN80244_c0_g1~~TRINITY_DN80244_c0_g1_i1.p1  ORF type:complete len:561 (-),score=110.28 TRINITY_DN80244_c0_g1_i1:89-1666(-)
MAAKSQRGSVARTCGDNEQGSYRNSSNAHQKKQAATASSADKHTKDRQYSKTSDTIHSKSSYWSNSHNNSTSGTGRYQHTTGHRSSPGALKTQPNHQQAEQFCDVRTEDVINAVRACYSEEAPPQDALVQWWLRDSQGYMPRIEEVTELARKTRDLQVQGSQTSRKGVHFFLTEEPEGFRGFPEDLAEQIPPDVFEEAAALALQGGWSLPGSCSHDRCTIADWLRSRSPFEPLRQLSLGRAMALVNLLLSSHSVLGKRQGRLVPYPFSEEFEKQDNARRHVPTGLREGEVCVTSWPQLLELLAVILEENGGELMSARLKVMFRTRFGLELSETALGHMSLGSLLEDPRMCGDFELVKHEQSADVLRLRHPGDTECHGGEYSATGKAVLLAAASPQRQRREHCGRESHNSGSAIKYPKQIGVAAGKQILSLLHAPQKLRSGRELSPETSAAAPSSASNASAPVKQAPPATPLKLPSNLPSWCIVRRTFIDAVDAQEEQQVMARSRRSASMPPARVDLAMGLEIEEV